jgi:transcriptional repressor NrdR
MRCPYCGNDDLKVLDSRPGTDGESIRRRRECPACVKRFTTWERMERSRLFVSKRDGSRCEFSRDKVFDSMRIACRKRPMSVEQLQQAAARIEEDLYRQFEDEVSSKEVGLHVLRELATMDTVAYVRFASVYQEFETVADFAEMVERVQTEEALTPFRHLQKELI